MAILVTGGAGYIGSVTVERLRGLGEEVVVLDNLSRGHLGAVHPSLPFYQGSVGNRSLIARIAAEQSIEACVHFAAFAYVGESVVDPALYWENNVEQGVALLEALRAAGVRRFIFSSSCTTYGEPERTPIDEAHPQRPTNPYGWTKLCLERLLESYDHAYGVKSVCLRYFNAAGATLDRGEDHDPEPHLIPLVLQVARGLRPSLSVFGSDYPTPDGTAVRDYVHVADLAEAHVLALQHLRAGGASDRLNLGTGTGYSVLELVETARQVTGRPIEARLEARRPGDPSCLVAAPGRAREVLGWTPRHSTLVEILSTAWEWHRRNPHGYAGESRSPAGSPLETCSHSHLRG